MGLDTSEFDEKAGTASDKAKTLKETLEDIPDPQLGMDTTDFDTGVSNATASTSTLKETLINALSAIEGAAKKAFDAVLKIANVGFGYNMDIEQYEAAFTTLMGNDREGAQGLVKQLEELATTTPLSTKGLAENAQTLMGYGQSSGTVVDTLRMLGDLAGGNEEKMTGLTFAFGQLTAAGKVNAQDMNQMISNGIPSWKLLADYLGTTVEDVRKMSKDGKITSDTFVEALKAATEEGGTYYEAMQTQADTLQGKLDTLKETSEQMVGKITEPFAELAKEEVLPKVNELLENFSGWIDDNKDKIEILAEKVGDFVTNALDWCIEAFKWVTENGNTMEEILVALGLAFAGIKVAVDPIGTAIEAVIGIAVLLIAKWDEICAAAEEKFARVKSAIENAIASLREFLGLSGNSEADSNYNPETNMSNDGNSWGDKHGVTLRSESVNPADYYMAIKNGRTSLPNLPGQKFGSGFGGGKSGGGGGGKSFASGTAYVPFDNYIANLHRGEQVLTKNEAERREKGDSFDAAALERALESAIERALENVGVYMDGREVGNLVADSVSANIGAKANRAKRYSGVFA